MSGGPGWDTLIGGDVSERPKELASKASVVQATVGSNPTVTARVALLEPPVSVPGVSVSPGRSSARHPSASSQVRWFSRHPPAFPPSAGFPGGNASFTVVRLSSRRLLALPTGMLVLWTNACATAQAHDRKASEPAGKVREVAAPVEMLVFLWCAGLLVACQSSRRLLALPTGMLVLWTNACATAQAHDRKASEPWGCVPSVVAIPAVMRLGW